MKPLSIPLNILRTLFSREVVTTRSKSGTGSEVKSTENMLSNQTMTNLSNLSALKILVRAMMLVFVLSTSGCETISNEDVEDVSICVFESVECITFKGKSSEKQDFEKIQQLLQSAKETASLQEKIRLYQAVLTELSPLSDKTAAELLSDNLNQEIEDYKVELREEEVRVSLQQVGDKIRQAQASGTQLKDKVSLYEAAQALLKEALTEYPNTDIVKKLQQGESVEGIRVSEIEQELNSFRRQLEEEQEEQAVRVVLQQVGDKIRQAKQLGIGLSQQITLYKEAVKELDRLVKEYGSTDIVKKLQRAERVEGIQMSEVNSELQTLELKVLAWLVRNVRNSRDELLLRTLTGHSGPVYSVSYSPDGTQLASGLGSDDATIRVWNVATGREIRKLTGHSFWVSSVSYSPDGTQLASSSWDKTIRLWDVATGRHIRTLTGHTNLVNSVSYSPDGTQLASGSLDGIRLWDVATGRHIRTLTALIYNVLSVSYSPDGKQLASGNTDGTIHLWDVATGRHIRTLTGHRGYVNTVSYSPDGKQLASGSHDRTIRLWDVATGRHIRKLTGHRGWVSSVSYSPDGKQLASGGNGDFTIRLWDVATGQEIRKLPGHSAWVKSVSYSPDGKQLASGSDDSTVRIWDISKFSKE